MAARETVKKQWAEDHAILSKIQGLMTPVTSVKNM